jgi:hypothetical protein
LTNLSGAAFLLILRNGVKAVHFLLLHLLKTHHLIFVTGETSQDLMEQLNDRDNSKSLGIGWIFPNWPRPAKPL